MRFSIKDILWLTFVVALSLGWRVDANNMRLEVQGSIDRVHQAESWVERHKVDTDALHTALAWARADNNNDRALIKELELTLHAYRNDHVPADQHRSQ